MPRFLIVIALVTAVLSAAAAAREKVMAPASLVQEIELLVKRQTDLLMKKDAAALAGLFADDAVYATASGEIFSGREKIRDYYSKTIPALGDTLSRPRFREISPVQKAAVRSRTAIVRIGRQVGIRTTLRTAGARVAP